MAIVSVGCTDPAKDYDDFQSRTASLVDASRPDTGGEAPADTSRDGSVFDEAGVASFSGDYWSACLEASYAGQVSAAVYDVFHLTFTQAADGSITVSGTRSALTYGATNVKQTVGETVTIPTTPVDANGAFSAKVATFVTPKEANVFGQDLTVENGVYDLAMGSPDAGCGHFFGKVTMPIAQDVDETCQLARPAADGSFVPLTAPPHCP